MTNTTLNDYKFTMDFNCAGGSFTNLANIVNRFGIPTSYIEVGVYEGSTAFWVAEHMTPHNKNLKIYAIDPHDFSNDLETDLSIIGDNFVHNLDVNKHKNVEYIKKYSDQGLIDLINREVKAELIYIDGDHRASTVLSDLVLAWKLLEVGGVMLCDDTGTWRFVDENGTASAQMSPRLAVESFINCYWHKLSILQLPDSTQTAFVKLED